MCHDRDACETKKNWAIPFFWIGMAILVASIFFSIRGFFWLVAITGSVGSALVLYDVFKEVKKEAKQNG